jgi:N6-adenosine-specific RNA methylase IME4
MEWVGIPSDRKYGCLCVDPPWSFKDKGSRVAPEQAPGGAYRTLSIEDIATLPLGVLAERRAHLYLWTTDSHIESALSLVRHWGFDYKHQIVWVKRGVSGKLQISMGHYFRKAHEVCLFATRGKQPALVHDLPSVIFAPRGRHSAKPELLQDCAEKLSPGPYLEMFGRRQRPGWDVWGNDPALSASSVSLSSDEGRSNGGEEEAA